jgi:CRISPR system Cascade subunit CasE
MTASWYLSRVRLRNDAEMRTLAPLLLPSDEDARIAAGHRLIWSLFAGAKDRQRDFLWHEEEAGRFLVLSPDPPAATSPLFTVESSPFVNWPQAGDRLAFFLRANPTASTVRGGVKANGKRRSGQRHDVVMQALHPLPGRDRTREPLRAGEGRAALREELLGWVEPEHSRDSRRPVEQWLARQGEANGFALLRMRVDSYRRVRVPRPGKGPRDALVFGQADIAGELTVTDAEAFVARLKSGFGRSKAFGCGLMLLARIE